MRSYMFHQCLFMSALKRNCLFTLTNLIKKVLSEDKINFSVHHLADTYFGNCE